MRLSPKRIANIFAETVEIASRQRDSEERQFVLQLSIEPAPVPGV
jgi:hypothetical protein